MKNEAKKAFAISAFSVSSVTRISAFSQMIIEWLGNILNAIQCKTHENSRSLILSCPHVGTHCLPFLVSTFYFTHNSAENLCVSFHLLSSKRGFSVMCLWILPWTVSIPSGWWQNCAKTWWLNSVEGLSSSNWLHGSLYIWGPSNALPGTLFFFFLKSLFCIFKTVLKRPKVSMYILSYYLIPLWTLWHLKHRTCMCVREVLLYGLIQCRRTAGPWESIPIGMQLSLHSPKAISPDIQWIKSTTFSSLSESSLSLMFT